MKAFICTKPLQIMICMILNNNEKNNHLYITDDFSDSKEIASKIKKTSIFKKTEHLKSTREALLASARETPEDIYIDSDVGLRPLINLLITKIISKKTNIHIYEEGIGTYRADIIKNSIKRVAYKSIGAGTFYGGCIFTKEIHVFNPSIYKKNLPRTSKKISKLSPPLKEWMDNNNQLLIEIFSKKTKISNESKKTTAIIYLANWNINISEINNINEDFPVFIKPHPHTSKEDIEKSKNLISLKSAKILPGSIPAEVIITMLLEKFEVVKIYHKNSSCINYLNKEIMEKRVIEKEI